MKLAPFLFQSQGTVYDASRRRVGPSDTVVVFRSKCRGLDGQNIEFKPD